jgi:hypothetical protein
VRHVLASLILFLLNAVPVAAQAPAPRPIVVAADAPWRHANSGMTMPVTLSGFPRTQVREYEAPELDVVGTWRRGDDDELTVYVTRSTAGSVPVWFDRATWAIESRSVYGRLTPAQPSAALRVPGAAVDTGLIATWTTEGAFRGTGVAILPVGEWLVKLRYSSTSRDGAAVADVLRTAVAGLGWPAAIPAAAAAQPIAACADQLSYKGTAKDAPASMQTALAGALGSLAVQGASGTRPTFCREGQRDQAFGLYRPDGASDRYLLALSDAGRGVVVGPGIGPLLDEKAKPSWSVNLALPGQTINFAPQDRLPRPERALALLRTRPVSSTSTHGPKREITLPSSR